MKDGIRYIRWLDEKGEEYVAQYISKKSVAGNVLFEYQQLIQDKEPAYSKRYWYAKVADLDKKELLEMHNEEYSVIYAEKPSYYARLALKRLLDLTVEGLSKESKINPFNRFDNSPDSPKRTICAKEKAIAVNADKYIDYLKVRDKIHHPYNIVALDDAMLDEEERVSCFPPFIVFCQKGCFPAMPMPSNENLVKVHKQLFGNKSEYEQKEITRTITKMLTSEDVEAWMESKRHKQQKSVMNSNSADDVAKALGLPKAEYEWLHLVAYSMGAAEELESQQEVKNLVLGTKGSNTQMMIHEMILKMAVLGTNAKVNSGVKRAHIIVRAKCRILEEAKSTGGTQGENRYATWLAEWLNYDYTIFDGENVYFINAVNFYPLRNVRPSLLENIIFPEYCYRYIDSMGGGKKLQNEYMADAESVAIGKRKISEAFASQTLHMNGLEFYDLTRCNLVNGEFIPVATGNAGDGPAIYPNTLPGGSAFSASVNALGKDGVPAKGILLDDGRKVVSMDFASANFTLDQLFEGLVGEEFSFLIFDDVKLNMEEQSEGRNILSFSGVLKMDAGPLTLIRDFLQLKEGVLLTGEMDVGEQALAGKIDPDFITLTSAATFYIPVFDGVVLTSAALKVYIGRKFDYESGSLGWTSGFCLTGTIELNGISSKAPAVLDGLISYNYGTLHVEASCKDVEGFLGIEGLTLDSLSTKFDIGKENDIELAAYFSPGSKTFGFGGRIAKGFTGIFASAENFTVDDINEIFSSISAGSLKLPHFDMTFEEVLIGIASADGSIGDVSLQKGLTLSCKVSVFEHKFSATAVISTDGVALSGSLGDIDIGPVHIKSAKAGIQIYKESTGKASEFYISGAAVIEGVEVECKVCYEKLGDTWNCVLYAGLHAKSISMSTIFPTTKDTFVDTLKFSKIAFIYSSKDCQAQDPDFDFRLRKGLQLMAVLEEVPALSDLTGNKQVGLVLSAHIGATTDIGIELPNTRLKLGNSVICDPFNIKVNLLPKPALDLIFGMDVTVPGQEVPLHFDVVLEAGIYSGKVAGTMKNWWIEPFGIKGLKIGPELALQAGIIYAEFVSTGLPSEFGFAGGLALGDTEAQMALSISEDPTNEILMGSVKRLTPKNLVNIASVISGITIEPANIPDFFDLEEIKIYCAPIGGSIGTITYDPGFSFSGNMSLFGKNASVYATVSDKGVIAKGHIDGLELGPLKISGEKGKNAELDLELTLDKQSVYIDGAFRFMDSWVGIFADISAQGVKFRFEEEFIGLLKYEIHGESSGSLAQLSSLDFLLAAEFDNHLTDYLKDTVALKIHSAINTVETSIDEAEAAVDKAEKEYLALFDEAKKKLDAAEAAAQEYLKQCTQKVEDEKKKYSDTLEAAKHQVNETKRAYDNAITAAQDAITKAEADYDAALREAEKAVATAQGEYDRAMAAAQKAVDDARQVYDGAMGSAVTAVQGARTSVASLQSQIDSADYELKHLSFWDFYKAPYYVAVIAGLEVAMATAQAALLVAEGVLQAVRYGTEYTAFEGAKQVLESVRVGGEYVALEAAKQTLTVVRCGVEYTALEGAKQFLEAVKVGTEYTAWQAAIVALDTANTVGRGALTAAEDALRNIGRSALYVAFEAEKAALDAVKQGSAAIAFDSAKAVLEGVRHGAEAMLALAEYVAKHAGDLVNIRNIKLTTSLKKIEQGELFKASIDVDILGCNYRWNLDFNVRDTESFIESLFKQSLEEAKKIVAV